MTKKEIYDYMTIGLVEPHPDIGYVFADGQPCSELYGKVYDARLRLSERTGIGFEDRDLMEIIESLEKIGELCALKMYDYGTVYGAS